jgi:superfamily II DNA helicase RecQ
MYGLKEEPVDNAIIGVKPVQTGKKEQNTMFSQNGKLSDTMIPYKPSISAELTNHEQLKVAEPANIVINTKQPPQEAVFLNDLNMMEVIGTVLHCVTEISKKHFFGTTVLLNVLRGSNNKKIMEYKLNETFEYGKLAYIEREALEMIVEWLISNKFLLKKNSMYPVLHITYNGIHFKEIVSNTQLKNLARELYERNPNHRFTIQNTPSGDKKAYPISAGMPWSNEEDKNLLEELKSGLKVSIIAQKHNRSNGAIIARIKKLTDNKDSVG